MPTRSPFPIDLSARHDCAVNRLARHFAEIVPCVRSFKAEREVCLAGGIAYCDLKVTWTDSKGKQRLVFFEVKTRLPSQGQLLRQLKFMRNLTNGGRWCVATDSNHIQTDFIQILKEEGFGFLRIPETLGSLADQKQGDQPCAATQAETQMGRKPARSIAAQLSLFQDAG